jgi:hypothetical protein
MQGVKVRSVAWKRMPRNHADPDHAGGGKDAPAGKRKWSVPRSIRLKLDRLAPLPENLPTNMFMRESDSGAPGRNITKKSCTA